MNKISFVLPIKINAKPLGSDLERVKQVLFPSLIKFLELSCIDQFLVIVPLEEKIKVDEELREFKEKLKLKVVSEEKIMARMPGWKMQNILELIGLKNAWKSISGWQKQQLIKISAAGILNTDYYMTLDADVCLTRPADFMTMFPDGKAIFTPDNMPNHLKWWQGSAKVLGIPFKLSDTDKVINVTPEILSRKVMLALIDHLACRSHKNKYLNVFEYLAAFPMWTEYTLYWLYLLEFHNKEDHYDLDSKIKTLHGLKSVWWQDDAKDMKMLQDRIDSAFQDSSALFLVIQSACIPLKEYLPMVKKYLKPQY